MQIVGDTHTHTLASGHAYSTLLENVAYAKKIGHRFLATTDHTGAMPQAPHRWFFENLPRTVPRILDGVVILRGCEANIQVDGTLDLAEEVVMELDWVIASMHQHILPVDLGEDTYTRLWVAMAQNPQVDVFGHMGQPKYRCDYRAVVEAMAKGRKILEVNAASPRVRKGSEPNCLELLRLCKEYGVEVVLSTDAHFATIIGQVEEAVELIRKADFPQELILNLDYNRFCRSLEERKGIILPQ